jgi:signal transduction histidine kinase
MRSLEQRVSLGLTAALGVLLMLGGLVAYPAVRSVLLDEFDYALLGRARALTAPSAPGGQGFSLRFTEYPPPEFLPGPRAEYFEVRTPDGAVVAKSLSLGSASLPAPDGRVDRPVFVGVTLPEGLPGRAVAIGLPWDARAAASAPDALAYTVVFARDAIRLRRALSIVLGASFGGGLMLVLIASWLARAATRSGLRPVVTLADQVTRIDAASLTSRLPAIGVPPELAPIVEQLNSLLARLHAAFDRERRFSANAAHELLTPVTELRAIAENAVRWREDKEATAEFAANVLDSARQMERLVNTLLALARCERGELRLRREKVNLVELLGQLRERHSERITDRDLSLEWSLPPDAIVPTDRGACESIVQNLFENAVEHAPPGGRISCRLERNGAGITLTLANSNPGLAMDDLARLWEPFWRRDAARANRAHTGLGLALVKSLTAALQYEVDAAMPEPGIFQMTLRIPAS